MSNPLARDTATIIPFPFARIAGPRLTARDRADLQAWETQARWLGYLQVTVCDNDLIMILWWGSLWTIRACTDVDQRFSLARHAGAAEAGFATLNEALNALAAALTSGEPGPSKATAAAGRHRP